MVALIVMKGNSLLGRDPVLDQMASVASASRTQGLSIVCLPNLPENDANLSKMSYSCTTSNCQWDNSEDRSVCETNVDVRSATSQARDCSKTGSGKWNDHFTSSPAPWSTSTMFNSGLSSFPLLPNLSSSLQTNNIPLHSRLKNLTYQANTMLNILVYLSASVSRLKLSLNSRTSGIQTIFFLLLLLLSSISTTSGQEAKVPFQEDSRTSQHSWNLSGSFDIEDLDISTPSSERQFEFPEFMVLTGRLFQYRIPPEAFPQLKEILHYQVIIRKNE